MGDLEKRKERRAILRRLEKAREGLFPKKTCPASRHVHIIVEGLLDSKSALTQDLAGYEPEHMAGSIASVLENLWQARRWMRWEQLPDKGGKIRGHWVPDIELIAADALSAKDAEITSLRAEVERMREALGPFADVAEWAERNGHDLLNDFDMLLRHLPGGQFAGHLQVQGPAFIAARAALGGADE